MRAPSGSTHARLLRRGGKDEPLDRSSGRRVSSSRSLRFTPTLKKRRGLYATPPASPPGSTHFLAPCSRKGFRVAHGEFGADMRVASISDGPVTLLFILDAL